VTRRASSALARARTRIAFTLMVSCLPFNCGEFLDVRTCVIPVTRTNSLKSRARNWGPESLMIRGRSSGYLSLALCAMHSTSERGHRRAQCARQGPIQRFSSSGSPRLRLAVHRRSCRTPNPDGSSALAERPPRGVSLIRLGSRGWLASERPSAPSAASPPFLPTRIPLLRRSDGSPALSLPVGDSLAAARVAPMNAIRHSSLPARPRFIPYEPA
jgi:hypothetical protein